MRIDIDPKLRTAPVQRDLDFVGVGSEISKKILSANPVAFSSFSEGKQRTLARGFKRSKVRPFIRMALVPKATLARVRSGDTAIRLLNDGQFIHK